LRQQQRVRAVASDWNHAAGQVAVGVERQDDIDARLARGAGVQRAAPDAAEHGERHLRRGLEDMSTMPRAHHRRRRR